MVPHVSYTCSIINNNLVKRSGGEFEAYLVTELSRNKSIISASAPCSEIGAQQSITVISDGKINLKRFSAPANDKVF